MKIAILICLSIGSTFMTGCVNTQDKQQSTNKVAISEAETAVEKVQVSIQNPQNIVPEVMPEQAKTIVRRTTKTPPLTSIQELTNTKTEVAENTSVSTTQKSHWIPNEVHLIRGNEIISGLQRDIGRKPTTIEMQQSLQSHMGLSIQQADHLITTLGLK